MKATTRAVTEGTFALRTLGECFGVALVQTRDRVAETIGGEDLDEKTGGR